VVLCDIGLPDMEGYAVAGELRAHGDTAAAYLIAVSGFASDEDQRRSLAAGFDLHLNKPEGFVGLSERLKNLPIRTLDLEP
jgi:two-component system CheB/CheR fusion protein